MSGSGLPRSISSPVTMTSKNGVSPWRSKNGRADALTELVATARRTFISRNRSSVPLCGRKETNAIREEFSRDLATAPHQFLNRRRQAKCLFVKLDRETIAHSEHLAM